MGEQTLIGSLRKGKHALEPVQGALQTLSSRLI